jgi:nucleotide-binding universal stress UspA family protein
MGRFVPPGLVLRTCNGAVTAMGHARPMGDRAQEQARGATRRGAVVLVGTDGSDTATKAVEAAARLAEGYGQVLVVAHAYRDRRMDHRCPDLAAVPVELRWQLSAGAVGEEIVERAMYHARVVTDGAIDVRGRSEAGDPAKVLLDLTRELDVATVVVGNVGMQGLAHRFTVPAKIARRAACPVVIVDTQEWARRGEPVEVPTALTMLRCA